MRYVITGCAGSGTRWAAKLFTELGSRTTHQHVFRVHGIQRQLVHKVNGDSSFFAAPLTLNWPTLLLIRNPLDVVRSCEAMTGFLDENGTDDDHLTMRYLIRHCPQISVPDDRLGRILTYVAYWDQVTSTKSVTRLFVDRCTPAHVRDAFDVLTGRTRSDVDVAMTMNKLGTKTGTHSGDQSAVEWQDIRNHPFGEAVIEKARRWGYL